MTITKQTVAGKIAAYLHHEISLGASVDWAENAMTEGVFEETDMTALRSVVSRLGLADVRTFWSDLGGLRTFAGAIGLPGASGCGDRVNL